MRTSAQRIAAFNSRGQSSLIDPTLTAKSATQQANFETYVNAFVPKQEGLRAILNDEGVSVIQVGAYEAFHGELWHAAQSFAGPALQAEFCILVAKWSDASHLGPTAETILERIGADLYSLDACEATP
jgi:hypothetical protein